MVEKHMYDGWSYERLRQQRNRAHFLLEEPYRFITVLLHHGKLYAIDSPCYHGSGPLGEGQIVDLEDMDTVVTSGDGKLGSSRVPCLRCPWHSYLISIETGELVEVLSVEGTKTGRENQADNDVAEEMPSYPLQHRFGTCGGATHVSRKGVVQRTHQVSLDEATGILTIEVEDEEVMRRRPLPSDKVAGDIKNGALTMQIFDIKARGLE
ncbi:uncharacterized protein TEOVI_000435000 [Trypanosoma equiperdum]|uniref:Soluble Rieske-type ferredoxin domain-containing protein n=4 Tax=Trypanozoon TaxID=39700 RepID=Q383Q4_TRYB2|nr:hypothetical protein, conserved [Trypanosoma brucei gambiense DAL972]XP_829089.1 hypothetical protein, conserved [Trypanosoma brucei brucei TREU927]RHW67599.1 hypothetical protein DPX39_110074100 [Trypanosoma brucei equiperdum]SCU72772.1 hypothetical protein, conserved [Trypanosoma equiperdum]EAN79977.1 hypothetical protein, conserved [Trypanosoma brucei brucei TREU927]CBH18032.1 hypothetical protein, conserved [Trypanosoma brucei gambiense DAL972]|eukprot:XP_011780296.1 hypothetical protein, conserved [Trypanosoma brucei gambiense DAL972]